MLLKLFNKTSFEKSPSGFFRASVACLVAVIFLTTGCTMVGPDFVKPEAPLEKEWFKARDASIKTEASDYKDWWTVFNDPVLNRLVESAYQQNLPLQISGLRILQARAQLGVVVGNLYPQLLLQIHWEQTLLSGNSMPALMPPGSWTSGANTDGP
jgi:outer membrane protein TolC